MGFWGYGFRGYGFRGLCSLKVIKEEKKLNIIKLETTK